MNLSTAKSEKRAKEVGIRKVVGSNKKQLIVQFFGESLFVTFIALLFAILLVQLALPFFNEISGKRMSILWTSPVFWSLALGFALLTGIIAGSYPSLYLSSFRPISVLKGVFKAGRFASVPRKVLVVFQFTVSIVLIIGTIVVFKQINYAKNRSIGYNKNNLVEVVMNTKDLHGHYDALRSDLINSGAVTNMSQSMGSVTEDYGGTTNISWRGKAPEETPLLAANRITHDYGATIGWELFAGRDFSRKFNSDSSSSILLNESAMQLMGFTNPLNEIIQFNGKDRQVIGVVKDVVKNDPFKKVTPSVYVVDYNSPNVINIKLTSAIPVSTALSKIESVFKKYNPAAPFEYKFVDEQFAAKFSTEQRIGKLARFFAILAIIISCLGLFGLSSFMAEQRTREIGVRKVLGASVINVWRLLSQSFVQLVFISFIIAMPVAYYFMNNWLQNYEFRTEISWWVFMLTSAGALVITLLTVSFQAIKAAIANPVKSLRTE